MKKIALWLLKAAFSGLIAFTGLTVFCLIYFNVPIRQATAEGATDYSWEYSKFYSRATEGFAFGRTNNEGYLNTMDYTGKEEIDVLVMGSSHMEAYQVSLNQSTAAFLGERLPNDTVYNIGVSGHDFLVCADNLSAAVAKYKPSKYVIIETSAISFSEEQLSAAINERVSDIASYSGGIIGLLQKNQFIRLLYTQLQSFTGNREASGEQGKRPITVPEWNLSLYNTLLAKLANTVCKSGAQLIIVYQANLSISEDGSATCSGDAELISRFAKLCENNDVLFLDMSSHFLRYYEETHILPHGFWNTSVGSGHLNKYGHKLIADALYDLIEENA